MKKSHIVQSKTNLEAQHKGSCHRIISWPELLQVKFMAFIECLWFFDIQKNLAKRLTLSTANMVDGTKTEKAKQNDYAEVEKTAFSISTSVITPSLHSNIYKNLRAIVSSYWKFNVHI